jgi:hypothetical protein
LNDYHPAEFLLETENNQFVKFNENIREIFQQCVEKINFVEDGDHKKYYIQKIALMLL